MKWTWPRFCIHIVSCLLGMFLLQMPSYAKQLQTLSLQFNREFVERGTKESIRGHIYCDFGADRTVIELADPIAQIMVVQGGVLEIYYPVERVAFRLKSKGRARLPFVDALFYVTQPDYGLAELGYSLQRHEMRGTTLLTRWHPPSGADKLDTIVIESIKERIVSVSTESPDGRARTRTQYLKYVELGGLSFPTEILSKVHESSTVTQSERVRYSSLLLNSALPDRIATFRIPDGTKIQETEW